MRIKSWELFEARELEYFELDEFNETHNRQPFSNYEYEEIKKLFQSNMNNSSKTDSIVGQIFIFGSTSRVSRSKSISITKLDDDWFSVMYVNPTLNHKKYWICDQFDDLISCLRVMKNKGFR